MAENFLIAGLALSLSLNFLVVPLVMWLGWRGVWMRLMKLKMRRGRLDASLYVDKANNIHMLFENREGSRVEIHKGSYVSTPAPSKIYRFWGIPLRIRRENDPEDIDLWDRENATNQTAKEIDNVVNEAKSTGIAEILKQYYPVLLLVVGILLVFTLGSIYLNFVNYQVIKEIAPEIVKQVVSFK